MASRRAQEVALTRTLDEVKQGKKSQEAMGLYKLPFIQCLVERVCLQGRVAIVAQSTAFLELVKVSLSAAPVRLVVWRCWVVLPGPY